jgi:hypothetical protein
LTPGFCGPGVFVFGPADRGKVLYELSPDGRKAPDQRHVRGSRTKWVVACGFHHALWARALFAAL